MHSLLYERGNVAIVAYQAVRGDKVLTARKLTVGYPSY
ncbi:hypothetical protein PC1_1913 [Pectobacterium carotovorum subsp. carotovorum PC1]|uniref:Uncharacterized protein n=1 Tax=Pectobacterium carotovorum subsp. carotovorum (strain PC1) TaxID=561230 RepID=C6DG11_PECCP|nr:hypothetical protein PC1_1913 [Pectobacterium carotovorum subsp. carotovorum PC1]